MELIQNQYDQYILRAQTEQQREVSVEVIVPDTQADVYSVLLSTALCQIKQKTLRKDIVTVEGVVEIEALCQEEQEDRWQIIRGSVPFSHEIEITGCTEESVAQLRMEVLRCEALIRNPRKLQLQAQIGAAVHLFEHSQFTVSESAAGSPEEDIQLLTEPVELDVLRAVCEKKLVATDEIQTGRQGKLLHYTVDWRQEEQRILSGKVMLRGNAILQTVFVRENRLEKQEYSVPFSQVVECEGVEPGDTVTVEYQTMQSQVTLLEGESSALSCSLTGTATACFTRKMRINVLRDAYSTRYATDCKRENLACPAWKYFEQTIPAEETCQPQEPAVSVMDCRVRARGFVEEADRMGGLYHFRILYCCAGGHLHCVEHSVKVLSDRPIEAEKLTVRAGWRDAAAQANEGIIRICFTAILRGKGQVEQHCPQVSRCVLDSRQPLEAPSAGTLVLRAVQTGETPWSIAKQYGSRVSHILSANKLDTSAQLTPGQLMIVPFSG